MKTIHLIFNAHIDPIWLWPWQAGLDEVLATCRSACDRLDAHPDLTFSRGEAWVYEQIEKTDSKLFERIRKHVESGRWEIVGGWWIQPDCNAPSGFAIEKQIAIGKEYFLDRFGSFPRIGYNVDSFGHAATLPGYMRAAGQDRYIMMRPQESEKPLPARLFRWRGYEGQPEVTTFRIPNAYTFHGEPDESWIRSSLSEIPDGIDHTMCFLGVGDHGGGPTETQIAWCKAHQNAFEGIRLEFSTPSRFFDTIEKQKEALPLVTGELQMHAVGCYSVYRPIKTALRKAEHRLQQAEAIRADVMEILVADEAAALKEGWKRVCFHQFHDTLGGTCLPSAYPQALDQLGYASSVADEALQYGLRRRLNALPDDTMQRIAIYNASDYAFDNYIEFEPWFEYTGWNPAWRLIDEAGEPLAFQVMHSEAIVDGDGKLKRLLFRLAIQPASLRVLRIDKSTHAEVASGVEVSEDGIRSNSGAEWKAAPSSLILPGLSDSPMLSSPELHLIDDPTDTWSHYTERYAETPTATEAWNAPVVIDRGPIMASIEQTGKIGDSMLRAEWRVYADQPFCDLRLSVHWREKHKILKLVLPLPNAGETRVDGIMGGSLERPNSGAEVPLRDWTLLNLADGGKVGVICTDVYAADVTADRLRLTLLRSPIMAHHVPDDGTGPRSIASDQGVHEFRFRLYGGLAAALETLEAAALALQRPPVIADLTRGMPTRFDNR